MTLRRQLLLSFFVIAAVLSAALSTFLIRAQFDQASLALDARLEAMRAELKARGLAIANTAALSSERALALLDFLFLTETVDTVVHNVPDMSYAAFVDKSSQIRLHSDQKRTGERLDLPNFEKLLASGESMSRELQAQGTHILEVIVPLKIADEPWGVLLLGLSMTRLDADIELERARLQAQLRNNMLAGFSFTLILLVLVTFAARYAAQRMTKPLAQLSNAVDDLRNGRLETKVAVAGAQELRALGNGFNAMSIAIKDRDDALQRNMHELRTALDKAEEVNRLKTEFLANVSHELRTPLNAIVNVPTTLLREYEDVAALRCDQCGAMFQAVDHEGDGTKERCPTCGGSLTLAQTVVMSGDASTHRRLLARLRQSSHHLLAVVNDILDFSKLEAGQMKIHAEIVQAQGVVDDVNQTVESMASAKRIKLRASVAEGASSVFADRLKLSQMLLNLLSNAIKFTPEDGTITTSVTVETIDEFSFARFSVADTGNGIPEDRLRDIFESFRQVDGSHTRSHGGTGLGLSITRQLAELHGGSIWVESVVGKGSEFFFTIPLKANSPAHLRPVSGSSRGRLSLGTVVVVDDSRSHIDVVREMIEQAGYRAVCVLNGTDAVTTIVDVKPCAVILDLMMPERGGFMIVEEIRANPKLLHLPLIISTAYHEQRAAAHAAATGWLPKPFDYSALEAALAATIRDARASSRDVS